MSIASLGIAGGLATSATAQRAADVERVDRDVTDQARQAAGSEQAENDRSKRAYNGDHTL